MSNASPVQTGFYYQDCVAVVLFFDHVKELESIRVEGDAEDVELTLSNGNKILSQVKYCNVNNQSKEAVGILKEALESLSKANSEDCSELIYSTNITFPLGYRKYPEVFGPHDHYVKYTDLPLKAKGQIDELLDKLQLIIEPEKLSFRIIGFSGSEEFRYMVIYDHINRFLSKFQDFYQHYDTEKLLALIIDLMTLNKTDERHDIQLSKNDLIWVIISELLSNVSYCGDLDQFDKAIREEIDGKYRGIISHRQERVDFTTRVIYDFVKWRGDAPIKQEIVTRFIKNNWERYIDEFEDESLDEELREKLISITLSRILSFRRVIPRIKEASGIVD